MNFILIYFIINKFLKKWFLNIQAGSGSFLGTNFFKTSYKFLNNYPATSTNSLFYWPVLPNAYFFNLSCLNTFKNSSMSLSYFASLSSLTGSFFVIGLNVLIFINYSLNIFTISFIDPIALFTYVPCLLRINSVKIMSNLTATSGVIPYLNLLDFNIAAVQSETILESAWLRIANALSIFLYFQKWIIGLKEVNLCWTTA